MILFCHKYSLRKCHFFVSGYVCLIIWHWTYLVLNNGNINQRKWFGWHKSFQCRILPYGRAMIELYIFFLCPRRVAYSDWHVRPSVRPSVRQFVKNHNLKFHTFGVIALCSLSYLNFVRSITLKLCQASTWNFIGKKISLRRSEVYENHNSKFHTHYSKGVQATDLKFHRQIDLIELKSNAQEP